MCTRIRFLGWAPGSRVPSQAPTISGSPAAIMGSGLIANPGISVNPNQSPNDNARYRFMVDLLDELQPKSARSQSGITLFRCLSPTTAIVEFRLLVSAMQILPESPFMASWLPQAAAIVEFRLLVSAMQILPESPFMASWLPQAYTRLRPASAVAGLQERERPQGVHTDRPCPLLREHAAVLLHKPELTRGYQRPYRRLSGHGPETAFGEITPGESRSRHGAWGTRRRGPWHMLRPIGHARPVPNRQSHIRTPGHRPTPCNHSPSARHATCVSNDMPYRVLVCDDQPDVLEALRLLLKGQGWQAVTAD